MLQFFQLFEILFLVLIITFSIGYTILLYKIRSGWDDTNDWVIPDNFSPSIKVSVVIAARNEEKYIGNCLKSILQCNFPKNLLEIIVINDHSEDKTEEVVTNFKNPSITLINLDNNFGKKSALEAGISQASGTIIACTDADCIVPFDWLMLFVSYFEENNSKCIAGPISYNYDHSTLQRFQFLDALNNMCVTANGIKRKTYYMANGANLFFSKQVFVEMGGYHQNKTFASGDDMFLIQQIANMYPQNISFLKSSLATVKTQPETSFSGLRSQRTRWATKSKSYSNKNIMRIQGFVFCFVIILLLNLVLSPIGSGLFFLGFLIAISIKLTADYLYLSKLAKYFKDKNPLNSFFGASLGFIIYIVYAGWKAIIPTSYHWKGRKTH